MKVRELKKLLTEAGWELDREGKAHEIWKHPTNPESIAVPRHPGDINQYTLEKIFKQAGWNRR